MSDHKIIKNNNKQGILKSIRIFNVVTKKVTFWITFPRKKISYPINHFNHYSNIFIILKFESCDWIFIILKNYSIQTI